MVTAIGYLHVFPLVQNMYNYVTNDKSISRASVPMMIFFMNLLLTKKLFAVAVHEKILSTKHFTCSSGSILGSLVTTSRMQITKQPTAVFVFLWNL